MPVNCAMISPNSQEKSTSPDKDEQTSQNAIGVQLAKRPVEIGLNYKILRAALTLSSIKKRPAAQITHSAPLKANIVLHDQQLWDEFDAVTNEMIITKSGRCLFPTLKVSIGGLDPGVLYGVGIDFVMFGTGKYKFRGGRKGWFEVNSGQLQPIADSRSNNAIASLQVMPIKEVYEHPESPRRGEHWNRASITFSKVKLTNRFPPFHKKLANRDSTEDEASSVDSSASSTLSSNCKIFPNSEGMFPMHSFHRYIPRLHIVALDESSHKSSFSFCDTENFPIQTCIFPQTSFIAVTHYQNNAVNLLKKNYNPHAKGFKETFYVPRISSSPPQTSEFSIKDCECRPRVKNPKLQSYVNIKKRSSYLIEEETSSEGDVAKLE